MPGVAIRTGSSREMELFAIPLATPARIQHAQIFENVGTFGNPRFHDVDWNLIAGGGLAFGRPPMRIVLDSRYGSWITSIAVSGPARGGRCGS